LMITFTSQHSFAAKCKKYWQRHKNIFDEEHVLKFNYIVYKVITLFKGATIKLSSPYRNLRLPCINVNVCEYEQLRHI